MIDNGRRRDRHKTPRICAIATVGRTRPFINHINAIVVVDGHRVAPVPSSGESFSSGLGFGLPGGYHLTASHGNRGRVDWKRYYEIGKKKDPMRTREKAQEGYQMGPADAGNRDPRPDSVAEAMVDCTSRDEGRILEESRSSRGEAAHVAREEDRRGGGRDQKCRTGTDPSPDRRPTVRIGQSECRQQQDRHAWKTRHSGIYRTPKVSSSTRTNPLVTAEEFGHVQHSMCFFLTLALSTIGCR